MKTDIENKIQEQWWAMSEKAIIEAFESDAVNGLSTKDVDNARGKFGSNIIEEIKPASALELIIEGVREPMMIVLLAIGGLSLLFGKTVEAVVMVFVVFAYIAVEFINKYRTDRTMTQLRKLTSPSARVIRSGKSQNVDTSDIVCGDIIILAEGARIPADARLVESFGLSVNEASLTGESLPVDKSTAEINDLSLPLAERRNMVFAGTMVLNGEGKALVVAVGGKSELGKIASEVNKANKEKTILQESMTRLAKILAVFAIAVSILIPAVGFLRGLSSKEMIVTWLALTFLMIPGQPPVIITMALALASFKLAKINLVVKRLHGVEALSQVTAIVTDKTGTITENRMQAESFILPVGEEVSPDKLQPSLKQAILHALPRYGNDPTDEAVYEAVKNSFEIETPLSFAGFSENQPLRRIEYEINNERISYVAGKAETMLENSGVAGNRKLTQLIQNAAENGKRVVAYGYELDSKGIKTLSLLAIAVLSDPIRKGVAKTLADLKDASIKTFIVTGDHPATAQAIARELGLAEKIVTGSELEAMDDSRLSVALSEVDIFARISPSQKLRIVEALKGRGETVAVIGDGVNDAPAIKAADVGIAMGEIGTDLAKETADLVLTDDNYAHVAEAIGIARSAIDNFRKGLTYYLTAKSILLAIFLVPLALGIPFPFAPIHIILTELLMDLASSTIFVTEAAEPDVLKKSVPKLKEYLGKELVYRIIRNGLCLMAGITGLYLFVYYGTGDITLAQTTAFVAWLLGHILLALNLKQEKMPLLKQGLFSNRFGAAWLFGMIVLALAITFIAPFHAYMKTSALTPQLWAAIAATIFVSTFWIEAVKWMKKGSEISNKINGGD